MLNEELELYIKALVKPLKATGVYKENQGDQASDWRKSTGAGSSDINGG